MNNYRRTLSAGTLVKDPVVNTQGEKIGTLKEIMLDLELGRVAYLVVSFGGLLGVGEKLFAIPYAAAKVDEDSKQIVIDITKEKLENSPGFDPDNWPDSTKFDIEGLYSFYKVKPYWEEDTTER